MYYVYMLKCADGSLYTGYTNGLQKRVGVHNSGRGAKYTKPRLPVRLVYSEEHESKSSALKREAEIKKLTRSQKEKLIKNQLQTN